MVSSNTGIGTRARRKSGTGRKRSSPSRVPGWFMLPAGVAIGVCTAVGMHLTPNINVAPLAQSAVIAESGELKYKEPVFDFYTLLPESEAIGGASSLMTVPVVVPPVTAAPAKPKVTIAASEQVVGKPVFSPSRVQRPVARPVIAEQVIAEQVIVQEALPTVKTSQSVFENSANSKLGLKGRFFLQAGSFRNEQDADRLRAELIISGYAARIESVTVEGSGKWHRVQLGPFNDQTGAERIRQQLASLDIESMVLRKR